MGVGRSHALKWQIGRSTMLLASVVIALSLRIPGAGAATPATGLGWTLEPSPSPDGLSNDLVSVSATSSSDVWAVGNDGSTYQTLIEHWNGTLWSVVPSPTPTGGSQLTGVVAISPTDAWAVGAYGRTEDGGPSLILHWDGSSWTVVPNPMSSTQSALLGVAATSSTDVWAVGWVASTEYSQATLVEHWNGTDWEVVPSPTPQIADNQLTSVSAVSATDAWAVGASNGYLAEHWNGKKWRIVDTPAAVEAGDQLNSVADGSPTDAWAVGYSHTRSGDQIPFVIHWDGAHWTPVATPIEGSNATLNGVTYESSDDVWATGTYQTMTGYWQTLIEHWDGAAWTMSQSPNPALDPFDELFGITALSASEAWAVGSEGGLGRTITMRYGPGTFTSSISASVTPTSLPLDGSATISGALTFSQGAASFGQTVHITRTNIDGTTTALPDVTTDSNGSFSTTDTPSTTGLYTYTAAYDGDASRSGTTATTAGVRVGTLATLTVSRSAATIGYEQSVTVTAHLSSHGTNDVVSIYRTPAGSPQVLAGSGHVSASGTFSVTVKIGRNNSFVATYAGDEQYAPEISPPVSVQVKVGFSSAMVGGYKTQSGYRLYHYTSNCPSHHTGCPGFTTTVYPTDHAGDCVDFFVQFHNGSEWHASTETGCIHLSSSSKATIHLVYPGPSVKGVPFRIRADFDGDAENAANYSNWHYFKVTS